MQMSGGQRVFRAGGHTDPPTPWGCFTEAPEASVGPWPPQRGPLVPPPTLAPRPRSPPPTPGEHTLNLGHSEQVQEKQGLLSFVHFPPVHAPCSWGREKGGETPRQGIKVKRAATFLLGEEGEQERRGFQAWKDTRDTEKRPQPKPGDQDLLQGHTEVRGESGLNRRSDQGQSSPPCPTHFPHPHDPPGRHGRSGSHCGGRVRL